MAAEQNKKKKIEDRQDSQQKVVGVPELKPKSQSERQRGSLHKEMASQAYERQITNRDDQLCYITTISNFNTNTILLAIFVVVAGR